MEALLGLNSSHSEEKASLSAITEEKDETIHELNEELNAQNASKEEILESVRQITQSVKEQLGLENETEFDDPLEELKNIIERLNDEYSAVNAMVENNESGK